MTLTRNATCIVCKKSFYRRPCRVAQGRNKYCSIECYWFFLKQKREKFFICIHCKKEFKRLIMDKRRKNKFCSFSCWTEYRKANRKEPNCKCQKCGKLFRKKPFAKKRGEGKFCSYRCRALFEWSNEEWKEKRLKSILKGSIKRPTSFEQQMIDLIKVNNLPYKYVGSGDFWIGGKNPDFVSINSEKKLIEVGNLYHHIKNYGSIENYISTRKKHYKKYGWESYFFMGKKLDNQEMLDILNSGLKK